MVNYWRELPVGPDPPKEIYVVIEMTRGSMNKYEFDKEKGIFKLDRVLYTYFPCDYGFIPQTLDDDGDPLDAVLLINQPTFTSCVVTARPIGLMAMIDEGKEDSKIIAVSTTDPFYRHIDRLKDVPESIIRELTYFFEHYKLSEGKKTDVKRWEDIEGAIRIIKRNIKNYEMRRNQRKSTKD